MCNCGGGSNYKFTVKGCNKKVDELTTLRNRMATLYNITKDVDLKGEYKEFRMEIDSLIENYYLKKTCPEFATINEIKQIVENEYSKYYR